MKSMTRRKRRLTFIWSDNVCVDSCPVRQAATALAREAAEDTGVVDIAGLQRLNEAIDVAEAPIAHGPFFDELRDERVAATKLQEVLAAPRAPLEGEQSCQAATGDTAGDIGVIEPSVFDAESVAVPTDSPRAPLEPREETPPDKQLREGDARYLRGLVRAHRLHGGPLLQPTNIEVLERVLWRAGLYSGPVTITEAARPRPALPQGPTFTLRGYRLRCPKCHHEWDSIFPATGWEGARCQQCGWQFGEPDYPIEVAHPALGPQE
jgi:hypothetical protein